MPKRKQHDKDTDRITNKIRKLERKLKRARKRNKRLSESSTSSSQEDLSQDLENQIAKDFEEPLSTFDLDELGDSVKENCLPEPVGECVDSNHPLPLLENLSMPPMPDSEIDNDLLEILGKDLSVTSEYGPDIHHELSVRLQHIATSGLDKETRKELGTKYLIPANCTKIAAPIMNDEIKAALPETIIKRDKGFENRQKQIGSIIACLSEVISSQLNNKNKDNVVLKKLMDSIKILCDIQYLESMKRRYFTSTALKKEINDHISKTKIDKYLYGENLAETLRSAKAVTKSGSEIRISQNITKYKKPQVQPSNPKNWRPIPMNRRQPLGSQRSRQPVPSVPPPPPLPALPQTRAPPVTLSRPSRYQQRPTYRR